LSNQSEAALRAVAIFLEEFRQLFPGRCFAKEGFDVTGQFWIKDHLGEQHARTVTILNGGTHPPSAFLSLWFDGDRILMYLPYRFSGVSKHAAPLKATRDRKKRYRTLVKFTACEAKEAARMIRRLVDVGVIELPTLPEPFFLDEWRIL